MRFQCVAVTWRAAAEKIDAAGVAVGSGTSATCQCESE
jgi:hypothetical protein